MRTASALPRTVGERGSYHRPLHRQRLARRVLVPEPIEEHASGILGRGERHPPRSSIPWCSARRANGSVDIQAGKSPAASDLNVNRCWAVLTLRDPYVAGVSSSGSGVSRTRLKVLTNISTRAQELHLIVTFLGWCGHAGAQFGSALRQPVGKVILDGGAVHQVDREEDEHEADVVAAVR